MVQLAAQWASIFLQVISLWWCNTQKNRSFQCPSLHRMGCAIRGNRCITTEVLVCFQPDEK